MTEITRNDFIEYEAIRRSGVTNMFDMSFISNISNLTTEKIRRIITIYSFLCGRYLIYGDIESEITLLAEEYRSLYSFE